MALACALICTLLAQPVFAHAEGGVLQIAGAAVGPYTLDVWTSPGILRPGAVHVETAVMRSGMFVPNSEVRVQMVPLEPAGAALSTRATPVSAAGDLRQEAAFLVETPGRYRVDVWVEDAAGRGGEITFKIDVRRVPAWIKVGIYLQIGLILILGIWLVRQGIVLFLPGGRKMRTTPV